MAPSHNYSLRRERDPQNFLLYREEPLSRSTRKWPIRPIKCWKKLAEAEGFDSFMFDIRPKRTPTSVTAKKRIAQHFIELCVPAKFKVKNRLDVLNRFLSSLVHTKEIDGRFFRNTIYEWVGCGAGSSDIGAQLCWILSKTLLRIPKTWRSDSHSGWIYSLMWVARRGATESQNPIYLLKAFDMLCTFLEKRFRNRTIKNPPPLYAFSIMTFLVSYLYDEHDEIVDLPGFVMVRMIDLAKKHNLRTLEIVLSEYPLRDPYEAVKEPKRLEALAFDLTKNLYKSSEIVNDEMLQLAIPELVNQFRDARPKISTISTPCRLVRKHLELEIAATIKYRTRGFIYSGYDLDLNFVRQRTRPPLIV